MDGGKMFMMVRGMMVAAVCVMISGGAGCRKGENGRPAAEVKSTGAAAQAAADGGRDALASAQDLLKQGNVDEAAAKLAQMQLQGASFDAQQAKRYRETMSEVYDRAIEAAQRGDPKGKAALQLLRAAAPR